MNKEYGALGGLYKEMKSIIDKIKLVKEMKLRALKRGNIGRILELEKAARKTY